MSFTIQPDVLADRLKNRQCLRCGLPGMTIDHETGFPYKYCVHCRHELDIEATNENRKKYLSSREREAHRREGLDNLDKLTGR